MVRSFEEKFLMSNIIVTGNSLIIGDGHFENYSLAAKGLTTVYLNIQRVLNHFIVAKELQNLSHEISSFSDSFLEPSGVDLYSINFGGFKFHYESFDHAAFFTNSFEIIPYKPNRIDMLKFVNRFLKNDALLSISIYNPHNEENKEMFKKGVLITEESKVMGSEKILMKGLSLDKNDYFYNFEECKGAKGFRHIFSEDELVNYLSDTGFEVVRFSDNDHLMENKFAEVSHMNELKGRYIVVLAKKVSSVKISRTL